VYVLLLCLCDVVVFLWPTILPRALQISQNGGVPLAASVAMFLVLPCLPWGLLYRFGAVSETRRRAILQITLALAVLGSAASGLIGFPAHPTENRELTALRKTLQKIRDVTRATLVCIDPASTASATSPATLRFTVGSLWPAAELQSIATWDAVPQPVPNPSETAGTHVVLAWGQRGRTKLPVANLGLRNLGPVNYYDTLEITAYVQAPVASGDREFEMDFGD